MKRPLSAAPRNRGGTGEQIGLAVMLSLAPLTIAHAQRTWTGSGANSNWGMVANWNGAVPNSSATNVIFTTGVAKTTAILDNDYTVGSLAFNYNSSNTATSFTVSGNNTDNSLEIFSGIANNTSSTQTVSADIFLGGTTTFATAGGGALNLDAASSLNQLNLNGQSLILTATGGINIASPIVDSAGGGAVTANGNGIVTLSGTNTFSGGLNVYGGEVSYAANANLGNANQGVTLSFGLLQYTGATATFGSGHDLTLGPNGGFDIANASTNLTLNQGFIASGPGASLTKMGAGTLTLNSANNYGGSTTIYAGTLAITASGALASGAVTDNGILAFTPTSNASFLLTSAISGSGSLTVGGSATVSLLATSNTYTGTTTVNGTLNAGVSGGSQGNLGTGVITNNGSIIFFGPASAGNATIVNGVSNAANVDLTNLAVGGFSIGSISGGGHLYLGGQALKIGDLNTNDTFSGVIGIAPTASSASGTLIKEGTGTLTLTGTNAYTGTTITGGTLLVNSTLALGPAKLASLSLSNGLNGGVFGFTSGGNTIAQSFVLSGTGSGFTAVNAGDILTVSGQLTGAGSLLITGLGAVSLSGNNNFTGGLTVSGGSLNLNGTNSAGAGAVNVTGGVGAVGGAASGFNTGATGAMGAASTVTVNAANAVAGTTGFTVTGGVGGTGGTGDTFEPGGAGGIGGAATLNASVSSALSTLTSVAIVGGNGGGGSGTLFIANGGVGGTANLNLSVIGGLLGLKNITLTGGNAGGAGIIASGGRGGTASLTFGVNDTSISNTTVIQFIQGASSSFNGQPTISGGGAVITMAGHNATVGGIDTGGIVSGSLLVQNGGISNSTLTVGTDNANHTFGGTIQDGSSGLNTGTLALAKTGTGRLTLTGNNTFTGGLTISGGSVFVSDPTNLSGGVVTDNASLIISSASGSAATFANNIGGTGSVSITGSGTTTLSGNSFYSGGTTLSTGTLAVGSNTALGNGTLALSGGTLSVSAPVTLNNAVTLGASSTFSTDTITTSGPKAPGLTLAGAVTLGAFQPTSGFNALTVTGNTRTDISGQIGETAGNPTPLLKLGSGTLELDGDNTYSGGTLVAAGTLIVNNAYNRTPAGSGTGQGAVTVASGATLAGTFNITGAIQINSGGTLSVGNSIGVGTAGSFNWDAGAMMDSELGANDTADLLNVTGALSKGGGDGTYTFDLSGEHFADGTIGTYGAGTYTLLTFGFDSGFSVGDFFAVGEYADLTPTFALTQAANGTPGALTLTLTENGGSAAAPEPGTLALLVPTICGGMPLLLIRRQSRQRKTV